MNDKTLLGSLPCSDAAARYEERETARMKWRGFVETVTATGASGVRGSVGDVTAVSDAQGEAELGNGGRL